MTILIRNILQWLCSKLLSLLAIIALLLLVSWFQKGWNEVSQLLQKKSQNAAEITRKNDEIAKLRVEIEKYGEAAKEALQNLDLKKQAVREASDLSDERYEAYKIANNAVSAVDWGLYLYTPWPPRSVIKRNLAYEAYEVAEQAKITLENQLENLEVASHNSPWAVAGVQLKTAQSELNKLEKEQKELDEKNLTPAQKLASEVRTKLPTALLILAGCILLPFGIKVFLFFCLAPVCGKLAPITISPASKDVLEPKVLGSGVAIDAEISPGEELLIHPDYLQVTPKSAVRRTKWFLNHRLPFSSLASGMSLLTKVSCKTDQELVTISAMHKPLSEVAMIEIPQGSGMVVFPRSLAAVIKPVGEEVSITRHWRLSSIHSWVTLQFRYLVFHGPCKLVISGCRGIRVEKPLKDKPRLISQSATIGFSANLGYSCNRSEVFISYLRGKDSLFNDLFSGEGGVFIYEEMPDAGSKKGVFGKGIEGVLDAALKAAGI